MTKDVEQYFFQKYEKASFRVVHGHWPDFKNTEEVDKWFDMMDRIFESAFEDKE